MAHIIGTSGAWKAVCKELNKAGLYPEKISDISGFLRNAKENYQSITEKSTKEVDDQIALLKTKADELKENLEHDINEEEKRILVEIELARTALELLQKNVSFIRKFLNYFRIRTMKAKIRLLLDQKKNCPRKFQEEIDLAKKNFEHAQKNRDISIKNKCKIEKYKVDILENACSSPDLAGATAELELIDCLKTLPDNYYVVSDVRLIAQKSIHFDNEWLSSAQIDHAVIGPSGIFVIEVKNWSNVFVQQGVYFNPYKQVKRASYLCYRLVGERYNLKTRSIIAHKGSIPDKPDNSLVKVLSINEVRNYILWFKETIATDQTIELVAHKLSHG